MKPLCAIALSLLLQPFTPARASAQLPPAGDPPYIPTPMALVEQMLDLGGVGAGDVVYDLGSGDGRIVIVAAERGARGVGVEYEGWLVARSRANADSAGVADRVRFVLGDVFEADVRDATVVTMYLGADFNRRLRPRLLEQLRPGSRIVSHAFHMDEWEADRTETFGQGASRATIYSWIVPAPVDGFWVLEIDGNPPMPLELSQRFQRFDGSAARGESDLRVEDGRLTGEAIRFALVGEGGGDRILLQGRWEDGRLSGIARDASGTRRWRALRYTDPALAPGG